MRFDEIYNVVESEACSNNWLVQMHNGTLTSMVGSACFSEIKDWEEYLDWSTGVRSEPKLHAPRTVFYNANHDGLTSEEYCFWMETILDHPSLEYYTERNTSWSNFGFIAFDARKIEYNHMLHTLGMLRAMREYPQMCKWAYAVYEATKYDDGQDMRSSNRKLARLAVYLGTQFQNVDRTVLRDRDGGGGHDPAGSNIYQLDLAHYIRGNSVIGGDSLSDNPTYDNISCGLRYHNVKSYDFRRKTLSEICHKINGDIQYKSVDSLGNLRKILLGEIEQLDALVVRHDAFCEAKKAEARIKALEKVKVKAELVTPPVPELEMRAIEIDEVETVPFF